MIASSPSPIGRGVISEIPLLIRKYIHLLQHCKRLTIPHSKLFPALPLSLGEGVGGEVLCVKYPYKILLEIVEKTAKKCAFLLPL